ncbi:Crp/Fnr family transcriptional regulator [Methylobacterium radiodurans]|uniref:Cyclic nucleotide-binding protein n=1 Tax=Methylobacterium radiodurans TaxID=2202828 RepID=A0A2U8VXG8_9HYPH|nr:Crp/Fnr family transcriptional regulator [Methylobacterium radiodurans]AWN38464.1 cyclic nucleotide-binding protein [Methylobacterium radiodurans]
MIPPFRNCLLRALPPADLALLTPHLVTVSVARGDVVVRSDEPFRHGWFPESGLASIISNTSEPRRLEVGLCGWEGMVSTALILGVDSTPHETTVQIEGTWLRIEAERLRTAMGESPALTAVLMRYVQTFLLVLSQTALSNGAYKIEERLARWLLLAHDRTDGDELHLTHEFLSLMLAVRRSSLTIATHMLEGAGMIRARRGLIIVLDRAKLEAAAGDTYGKAEEEYERLIGPYRKTAPAGASCLAP